MPRKDNASNAPGLAHPKLGPRKAEKARAKRQDQAALRDARALVFAQDDRCRFPDRGMEIHPHGGGDDELAHMDEVRRARTVNQPPEARHPIESLLRLCPNHHRGYDGGIGGKTFRIEYLTGKGARGLCRFFEIATGAWLGDG